MRSSTRTGVASCSNRIRQASKIATAADRFCGVSRRIFPFIQRVFADSGYASEKVAKATLIAVEIVRKNRDQVGFAVNPRRRVVERFFAWIGRNRRLAKDFGHHQLRPRLPLRRIRHAARASDRRIS